MSTKKKKNSGGKSNRPNYGNKSGKLYVPDDMERMMNAIYLPNPTALDKSLAVAAAYASDVIDFAKDNGVILDLTLGTEKELNDIILPRWLVFKRQQNRGDDWAREQLEKSIASYELFLLCNFINEGKDKFGLLGTIERNKMAKAGIELQATNKKTHKAVAFNPYSAIAKVSEECFSFSDASAQFVCSLAPFAEEVKAFIEKAADIATL